MHMCMGPCHVYVYGTMPCVCAWDHAMCMCMGPCHVYVYGTMPRVMYKDTPRTRISMSLCALVLSRDICFYFAFNIHLTVL